MNKLKISAIVPTYNSVNTLKQTIKSLLTQTYKLSEILIIDNNSTDGTSEIISKAIPKVSVIVLKTNTGVTGGRNAGIKQADKQSDFLLFIDHDMVADKRMVEELVQVAIKTSDGGIFTPKIYYLSDKQRIWSAGTGVNLYTGQILFRGGKDIGQYEFVEEVQVAPAAILVSMKVIKKIKRFDPKYFATYEDTDFCFRARNAGFKTIYVPKSIAYHDLVTDPVLEAKRLLQRLYWVGKNRILFMRDFGKPVWWIFLPIFLVYYLRLSLKYGSINDYWQFLRGTYDGVLNKK